MDDIDITELCTGIGFVVDFDDMTAYNGCLNLCYKSEEIPQSIIDNIDTNTMELAFYYIENKYDTLKLTCACKDPELIVKYNDDARTSSYWVASIDYNKHTKKISMFFKLENSAIPHFINESIDELYYDLVETKIDAYVKEQELKSIIEALNNELKMLRQNA